MLPAQQSSSIQSTTQSYLEIYDITNDLILMKDGSVAMVLQTNAINFGLLSEEEQDATIYTYAGLLNSLSFPVEILIRSQKKDVTTYLSYLKDQEQTTMHALRKTQLRRYREFVQALVQETNVLDKKFFLVIPMSMVELGLHGQSFIGSVSGLGKISKKKDEEEPKLDKMYVLEKAKTNLDPKRDHLIAQLSRIGLMAKQLNTQELIQLLYSIYNPESASDQAMTDSGAYTTPLVEASLRGLAEQPVLQSFTQDAAKTPLPSQTTLSNREVTPAQATTLTQQTTQMPAQIPLQEQPIVHAQVAPAAVPPATTPPETTLPTPLVPPALEQPIAAPTSQPQVPTIAPVEIFPE